VPLDQPFAADAQQNAAAIRAAFAKAPG